MELVGQTFMFTGSMMHGSGLFYSMRATAEHATAFTFTVPTVEAYLQGIDKVKVRILTKTSIYLSQFINMSISLVKIIQ